MAPKSKKEKHPYECQGENELSDIIQELSDLSRSSKYCELQPTVFGKAISQYFGELSNRLSAVCEYNKSLRHALDWLLLEYKREPFSVDGLCKAIDNAEIVITGGIGLNIVLQPEGSVNG